MSTELYSTHLLGLLIPIERHYEPVSQTQIELSPGLNWDSYGESAFKIEFSLELAYSVLIKLALRFIKNAL